MSFETHTHTRSQHKSLLLLLLAEQAQEVSHKEQRVQQLEGLSNRPSGLHSSRHCYKAQHKICNKD